MIIRAFHVACVAGLLLGAACSGEKSSKPAEPVTTPSGAPAGTAVPGTPARGLPAPRIVFLGDSLTAGQGLDRDQSYPALLQKRLNDSGYVFDVINAGVSGDTSAGGVRRVDWSLEGDVKVLVIALGANDGLRGLPVGELKKNLAAMIERGKQKGAVVILAGMEAPPNNGQEYAASFRAVYQDLAKQYSVRLIPFMLEGVAGLQGLNQSDGIHPNAKGAQVVADVMWTTLEPTLKTIK